MSKCMCPLWCKRARNGNCVDGAVQPGLRPEQRQHSAVGDGAGPAQPQARRESDEANGPHSGSRQAKRQAVPVARTANVATAATNVTPSAARDSLNQAPTGQTATTVDRSQFDNKPVFSVADLLGDSPGIDMKQGNGPRDIGISIRGSNARNGFGIRNIVIFDDGFPVTQPDGLSRSDLIDPHAYGAIDVITGTLVGTLRKLCHRRRAEFPDAAGRHYQWR